MVIQIPTYGRIEQILELNNKYLITHLTDEQQQSGFISIAYSREDVRKIIEAKEMVVALDEDKIVGYYLIGRKSENPALDYQRNKVKSLFDTQQIPFDKIGYGAQAIIETEYRRQNMLSLMLSGLIELLDNRYNMLFSSVTKINSNALKAHIKGGYELLGEDDTKYYVGLLVNKI